MALNEIGRMYSGEDIAEQLKRDLAPAERAAAKDREIARLREALERILPRSIANSNDDLNECKRQMMHIAALARAALAQDGRE